MAKRTLRVERLARKEERKMVKRIVSLSIISLVIAVFLFTLGVPVLGKFADFLETIFQNSEQATSNQSAPTAPRIENIPPATNSARLAISGFSSGSSQVDIYLNGEKIGKTSVFEGKFKYEDVTLKNGENKIEAKAVNGSGISDFSPVQVVIFDKNEPKLEIEGPTDDQFFFGNNRIKIFGSTESDSQVFANGFLASVGSDGKFEVFLSLSDGENNIEIKAVDAAGNTKIEMRKVTYRK